jgi:hypothetical protein
MPPLPVGVRLDVFEHIGLGFSLRGVPFPLGLFHLERMEETDLAPFSWTPG